jgi:hypothetical protein
MKNLIKTLAIFTILFLTFSLIPVKLVHAASPASVEEFASYLPEADSSKLVGVFAKDILAASIVQQSSAAYVSSRAGTVTQFGLAGQYGSIGLLAHNYLSGASFSRLGAGSEIYLIYGDGSVKKYQVSSVKKYQALRPNDPYSDFKNLDNPDSTLSSSDLFSETYGQSGKLVLQTCISKDGQSSWGRLFIIASPV